VEPSNQALLTEGLRSFGFEPSPVVCESLIRHLAMVAEWNERMNLTAITDEREMVIKHVLDSAAGLTVVDVAAGTRVLDVGSGAGFPGVVWKCLRPEAEVVLLESLQKRCRFLEAVGEEVIRPLTGSDGGYRVLWARAEDAGHRKEEREQYDVVTARAVAAMRVLVEYCLPFVRVGGRFVALKGPDIEQEVSEATRAMDVLGGQLEAVQVVHLPEGAGTRSLVVIRKAKPTPAKYPRKAGVPAKNPI